MLWREAALFQLGRIAQIVRQMLDLPKPHQESPKQFRADEAIREVVALTKPNFHERHITCEQDLQRARKIVMLPENMLRQILYNVMLNAAEASPLGGLVCITAEIATRAFRRRSKHGFSSLSLRPKATGAPAAWVGGCPCAEAW